MAYYGFALMMVQRGQTFSAPITIENITFCLAPWVLTSVIAFMPSLAKAIIGR